MTTGSDLDPSASTRRADGRSRWAWAALLASALAVLVAGAIVLGAGGPSPRTATAAATRADRAPTVATTSSEAATALGLIKGVSAKPLVEAGKPLLFFMGGQFCAFCAAERWAFVQATSRFGTWTNLRALHSRSGADGFASLATYDFMNATFQSTLLTLRHKEVADLSGNTLQQLDRVETGLVNAYDAGGGIPLIVAGGPAGQYTVELAYSPKLIEGQSYQSLRSAVAAHADTAAVRAIGGEADAMTALLCKLSGGKPARVCSAPLVTELQKSL